MLTERRKRKGAWGLAEANFLKTQCPMHARKVDIIIYSMAHRKRERKNTHVLEVLSGGLEARPRGISSHPSFALVSFRLFVIIPLPLAISRRSGKYSATRRPHYGPSRKEGTKEEADVEC